MQLFITDEFEVLKNDFIIITEDRIIKQLRKVLRAKHGYNFFIQTKNTWKVYRYKIKTDKITDKVFWNILKKEEFDISMSSKWVIMSILNKFSKMEFLVQKLTEIWISKIYFVPMERSVFKDIKWNKLERFKKIALEATEQSRNYKIPDIKVFSDISQIDWNKAILNIDWDFYKKVDLSTIDFMVVWPEWWFSDRDLNNIGAKKIISLWQNILRAETAWILSWFILM